MFLGPWLWKGQVHFLTFVICIHYNYKLCNLTWYFYTYINLHMGVQCVPWRRLELNGRSSSLLITTSAFRLFFCWFFLYAYYIKNLPWLYIMPKSRHNQLTSHLCTYTYYNVFSVTTCFFFDTYINSGTPSLSCYVHVYQFSDKLYRIKNTIRVSRFSYITYYKGENNFSFLKNSPFWHYINSFTRPNRVYVRLIPNDLYFQTICTA